MSKILDALQKAQRLKQQAAERAQEAKQEPEAKENLAADVKALEEAFKKRRALFSTTLEPAKQQVQPTEPAKQEPVEEVVAKSTEGVESVAEEAANVPEVGNFYNEALGAIQQHLTGCQAEIASNHQNQKQAQSELAVLRKQAEEIAKQCQQAEKVLQDLQHQAKTILNHQTEKLEAITTHLKQSLQKTMNMETGATNDSEEF